MKGAGLDEFSMSAVSILNIKRLLKKWTVEDAKEVTEDVLELSTAEEVKLYLESVKK
ncbi:MAG: hypothetical protein ACOC21_03195 [Halanaerobiales bacterium]